MKLFTISIIFLLCSGKIVSAQEHHAKDTLYFLLDTAHTAVNDRMISIGSGKDIIEYIIQCPCLSNNRFPILWYRPTITAQIEDINFLHSIRLITLPHLISLIKNNTANFNNKYILYVLQANKKSYLKRLVHLDIPTDPVINSEIIHQ